MTPEEVVTASVEATGLEDFGEPEWREGLDRLVDSIDSEADVTELGQAIIDDDLQTHVKNRLQLIDWRKHHDEVSDTPVEAPIFIIGQARTGTTILFDLLSQDPAFRAPLTWEVDEPFPPAERATFTTDPRIPARDEHLAGIELLIPGFMSMHPMGATLPQECVRITGGDFRSMIFPTQWRVPSYAKWVLHEADMSSAYRYHRMYLEHLGSRLMADRWVLKSPGHIWSLDALMAEYPDARLIQTHRDPLATAASVSSLMSLLRQIVQESPDIEDIAGEFAEYIFEGFDRSVDARESGLVPPDQVIDIHFGDFMDDHFVEIARIYDAFDMEFTAEAEAAMRSFLADHNQDKRGRHSYTFAQTGLDYDASRERTAKYTGYFNVHTSDLH